MKRYQNPDVYERLALEYSLGTMHGRVRKRFERLMQQHPFLQIVVEEYDHKFAKLVDYLPEEKPSEQVWKNIEAQLGVEEDNEKNHWWLIFTSKGFATAMVSIVLLVSIVFVNVTQYTSDYSCELASENAKIMFTVVASKADMKLNVSAIGNIEVPEGKQMYFWCVPKNADQPIMGLGLLSKTGMQMKLTAKSWEGIEEAHMFGVSLETKGSKVTKPTGDLIYKGDIESLKQT